MKALLWTLAVLVICALLAVVIRENPGYVLIDIDGWVIQSTLVFFVVVLLLTFALFHYGLRIWSGLRKVPRNLGDWQEQRAKDKVDQSLITGMLHLVECNWAEAEQHLIRYAEKSQAPLLNYLGAARAAQERGAFERRDKYLSLAQQSRPKAQVPVGLTQAELQLNQNQREQALATYTHLHQMQPKNKQVLNGLANLYRELSDWDNLLRIIGAVRKNKAMPDETIDSLERQAYLQLLRTAGNDASMRIEDAWYRVAAHLQSDDEILITYVELLLKQGSSELAEPLIRNALKRHWNDSLIHHYGVIAAADPYAQLQFAERLLMQRENDAGLLLTLGRLCITNGLWGKARAYLEASIGAAARPEAYAELGRLLESMGEHDAATDCYRKGLRLVPGCEVELPNVKPRLESEQMSDNVTVLAKSN